jgi:hypothetical protein
MQAGELVLRSLCVPVSVRAPCDTAERSGRLAPGSGGTAAQLLYGQLIVPRRRLRLLSTRALLVIFQQASGTSPCCCFVL